MKAEPIKLPVKNVRNVCRTDKGWSCDVTFGIPDEWENHDDPTITCTSENVEKYPQPGDVMLVYPPRIAGYAMQENEKCDGTDASSLFANFIETGNAFKALAKSIRHEDGDRAWIRLDELKRDWVDAAWLLHDSAENA